MSTRFTRVTVALAALLLVAGCGTGAGSPSAPASEAASQPAPGERRPSAAASQTAVELTFAHSYQDAQPQHACGAKVIADELAAADVGVTTTISGASQLGGDADRIASVVAGDIDMDIQGASALSALYPPIGRVDGAFVFDDSDHLHRFFTSEASQPLKDAFLDGDRCSDPRRLVRRGSPVHREQADPHARGPAGPADAVPAIAPVPDERRSDGCQLRSRSRSRSSTSHSSRARSMGRRTRSTTSPRTTSRKSRMS